MRHPLADVQSDKIGEGTRIWQFTVVLPGAAIGRDCNIGANCFIESKVSIGDNVTVKNGVQVWDEVALEDDVFVGPNATFTNDFLPRSERDPQKRKPFLPTRVKRGASIGANATIVCGVTIGEYAMIGAGSVVTHDIPPYTLWYGNPARCHGKVNERGEIVEKKK